MLPSILFCFRERQVVLSCVVYTGGQVCTFVFLSWGLQILGFVLFEALQYTFFCYTKTDETAVYYSNLILNCYKEPFQLWDQNPWNSVLNGRVLPVPSSGLQSLDVELWLKLCNEYNRLLKGNGSYSFIVLFYFVEKTFRIVNLFFFFFIFDN